MTCSISPAAHYSQCCRRSLWPTVGKCLSVSSVSSQSEARGPGSRANDSPGQMTPAGISSCLTLRQFTSLSSVWRFPFGHPACLYQLNETVNYNQRQGYVDEVTRRSDYIRPIFLIMYALVFLVIFVGKYCIVHSTNLIWHPDRGRQKCTIHMYIVPLDITEGKFCWFCERIWSDLMMIGGNYPNSLSSKIITHECTSLSSHDYLHMVITVSGLKF